MALKTVWIPPVTVPIPAIPRRNRKPIHTAGVSLRMIITVRITITPARYRKCRGVRTVTFSSIEHSFYKIYFRI